MTAGMPVTGTGLPTCVPPMKNVTVPEGGAPPLLVLTVAENVPPWAALLNASAVEGDACVMVRPTAGDRKSTRLNSSHTVISYAVFCLKKKKKKQQKRKENQTSPRVVRGADNHPRGDDDVCANPADAPVAWTVLAINQRRNPAARQCHR